MASGPYKCYGAVFDKEFIENNKEKCKIIENYERYAINFAIFSRVASTS